VSKEVRQALHAQKAPFNGLDLQEGHSASARRGNASNFFNAWACLKPLTHCMAAKIETIPSHND